MIWNAAELAAALEITTKGSGETTDQQWGRSRSSIKPLKTFSNSTELLHGPGHSNACGLLGDLLIRADFQKNLDRLVSWPRSAGALRETYPPPLPAKNLGTSERASVSLRRPAAEVESKLSLMLPMPRY